MSKYEKINNNYNNNIENIISDNEEIIWSSKPKKSAFIINKVLMMLPFALIWLILDSGIIIAILNNNSNYNFLWFIIPFFALHLMPVWIWLGNVLTAKKHWENTIYAVTDKRIIISSGFVARSYQTLYYKDIKNVNLVVGIIDKMLNVGDIYFDTQNNSKVTFLDVENPYEIYSKVQKIVLDIQTDIEYPNDLRPAHNSGYNTKYRPKN